jgi:methyltransferase (TIGR00027 family)
MLKRFAVVMFAMCSVVPSGLSIQPGLPSRTAVITAAARAIATHDPDPSVRNPDWLAEHFLGDTERKLLAVTPWAKALDDDYRHLGTNPEVDTLVRAMLVRTRFIDEHLKVAIKNGATQIVVLGAGFDSRAYRLREVLGGARVFEVDFGPTREYKKRRIPEVLGALPRNVVYVPIDFTRDTLKKVLERAG